MIVTVTAALPFLSRPLPQPAIHLLSKVQVTLEWFAKEPTSLA